MFMLQYHWNIEYALSVHLFYGRFYLLALSCRMVTKGRTHLNNPVVEKWRFKFVWHFGTMRRERANKIYVYGYPLGPARNY